MMPKPEKLLILVACLFLCCSCKPAKDHVKPNIIFILIDDLGWTAPSCYGDPYVNTQNIDRIAAEGMKFTNAYVTPQCTPTRAVIMTGQHTTRNKMWHVIPKYYYPYARLTEPEYLQGLSRDTSTVAEALKAAGYTTACLGKWHLHNYGSDGYYTRLFKKYAHYYGFDYVDPVTDPPEYQHHGDKGVTFLTNQAIQFMTDNKDKPFFIYLSHHTIHNEVLAPNDLVKKYLDLGYPKEGQQSATYLAAIEHFDNEIGRLSAKINELGLEQKTIVIFTSDNGGVDEEFDNAPLRAGKGTPYEGGIRVPFIVKWPGMVKPGTTCDTPIHAVDFYPTMVDMAGGDMPTDHKFDGLSIVPLLKQQDHWTRTTLHWYMPLYDPLWDATPAAVVRQGDYKLIHYFGDFVDHQNGSKYIPQGHDELYNLAEDIGETHDLSLSMPEKTQALLQNLNQWMQGIGVEQPRLNPNYNIDSLFVQAR